MVNPPPNNSPGELLPKGSGAFPRGELLGGDYYPPWGGIITLQGQIFPIFSYIGKIVCKCYQILFIWGKTHLNIQNMHFYDLLVILTFFCHDNIVEKVGFVGQKNLIFLICAKKSAIFQNFPLAGLFGPGWRFPGEIIREV